MNVESIKTSIVLALLKLVAHLPLRVLYILSDVICPLVQHVIRYRREVVYGNLRRSFPEKDEAEIRRIAGKFYHHLCDIFMETVKMLHLSDEELQRRVTVTGMSLMEDAAADGRPVFLFIGHYGNWEWVQEVTRRIKAPTVHGEIYNPLKSKVFDQVMKTIRNRYPTILIEKKQAVRTILRMKRDHDSYLIGFIADQRPTRHSLHHWTTFLSQDTPFMVGAEEIGSHVGAKYLFLDVEQPRRGHYIMNIQDMAPTAAYEDYPFTRLYMEKLEATIRRQPELWLWTHKRWKHKRVNETTETVNQQSSHIE